MKKSFIKSLITFILLIVTSFDLSGQQTLVNPDDGLGGAVSISGSNNVNQNDTATYYASINQGVISSGNWYLSGGTILSQNATSLTVKWTSSGLKLIEFIGSNTSNALLEGFYSVTVNVSSTPSVLSTPIITNQNCANATLIIPLNTFIPTGEMWYWQGTSQFGVNTIFPATSSYLATTSGRYYLRSKNNNGTWSTTSSYVDVTIGGSGCSSTVPSLDQNYTHTTIYKNESTQDQAMSGNVLDLKKIESIKYFDGIGRIKQSIGIRQGISNKDIVTYIEYDNYGRKTKGFLPYQSNQNTNGNFKSGDIAQETKVYYKEKYNDDFVGISTNNINPYSEKKYDNPILNREIEIGTPGNDWKINTTGPSNTIKKEYRFNTNSSGNYKIRKFSVNHTNNDIKIPVLVDNNEYYLEDKVYVTITKNENWTSGRDNTIEEYKDLENNVLLERKYNGSDILETYFVYDKYKNITYVITPKVTLSDGVSSDELQNLCFQYVYDIEFRIIKKKLPGKGEEYIIYDRLNRPILTQSALQKEQKEWLYTKYDVFGRVVYTGVYTHDTEINQLAMQSHFDLQNNSASKLYESKVSLGTGIEGSYYTNSNFPNNNVELLTVSYYDNYLFNLGGSSVPQVLPEIYGERVTSNVVNLKTGSKIKVLETASWITSVNYYDDKARAIYKYSANPYLVTTDIIENKIDFSGKTIETKTIHKKTGKTDIVTLDLFEYDHMNRLLSHKQRIGDHTLTTIDTSTNTTDVSFSNIMDLQESKIIIDNNSIRLLPGYSVTPTTGKSVVFKIAENDSELIVYNNYDELGVLTSKKVGNKESNPLQIIDYKYNVRDWLTNINQDSNTDNDLFNLTIKYNNPISGTALYNGNISQTEWSTLSQDTNTKTYTYTYDALNRITQAVDNTNRYNLGSTTNPIEYDKNGNILKLYRKGHIVENPLASISSDFNVMDNLTYVYDSGNKLLSVTDAISTSTLVKGEFKDGSNSGNDYTYDLNGNLLSDTNKGITAISYNHLNLPTQITLGNKKITYVYDALGAKLSKSVFKYASPTVTQYAGKYIYQASASKFSEYKLQFFNHSEGYIKPNNSDTGFDYIYQYKDHLGNVRLTYSDTDSDGQISQSEIIEESNYYPFGLKHKGYNNVTTSGGNSAAQQFGFTGKEHQDELGLGWIDITARNYDAALGRWMNLDPLTEQMRGYSPYNYAFNNPIFFIDPDGNMPIQSVEKATAPMWDLFFARMNYTSYQNGYGNYQGNKPSANYQEQMSAYYRNVPDSDYGKQMYYNSLGQTSYSSGVKPTKRFLDLAKIVTGYSNFEDAYNAHKQGNNKQAFYSGANIFVGALSGLAGGAKFTRSFSNNSSRLARNWQGKGNYPGVDNWRNITLKKGTHVVGGVNIENGIMSGQSNYYTTTNGALRSNFLQKDFFGGVQVMPHRTFGLRNSIGIYEIPSNRYGAFGTTYANPQFGSGGLPQIYIPDYSSLKLLYTIPLK